MKNIMTRRDFLKLTGVAAGAATMGAAGAFNLAKVAELFEKYPEATGLLKVESGGSDYYLPVYGGEK